MSHPAPDPNALAVSGLPLAYKLADSFMRRSRDPDHYESAALYGLAIAAMRFDPNRGVKFTTYAHWMILNELKSAYTRERRRCDRKPLTFVDCEYADGDPIDPMDPASDPTEARSRRQDAELAALADLCESRMIELTPDPPGTARRLGSHVRPATRSTERHRDLVAVCRAALAMRPQPANA